MLPNVDPIMNPHAAADRPKKVAVPNIRYPAPAPASPNSRGAIAMFYQIVTLA